MLPECVKVAADAKLSESAQEGGGLHGRRLYWMLRLLLSTFGLLCPVRDGIEWASLMRRRE